MSEGICSMRNESAMCSGSHFYYCKAIPNYTKNIALIEDLICTLMRLWLRHQRGCIFYVSSNAAEYHLPTYLRLILRSLGLSLNTVVLCGIMPSMSNCQIASSECRNRHCASTFLHCTTKRSQAHGRSFRNKDRPSLICCKTKCFK